MRTNYTSQHPMQWLKQLQTLLDFLFVMILSQISSWRCVTPLASLAVRKIAVLHNLQTRYP